MPPNPEKSNTILRSEFMAESRERGVRRVEQVIRGRITNARVGAVLACLRSELRIPKPEAVAC